jgi:hypothetical protein
MVSTLADVQRSHPEVRAGLRDDAAKMESCTEFEKCSEGGDAAWIGAGQQSGGKVSAGSKNSESESVNRKS